jgi:Flp pilus assembly protein TadD
MPRLSSANVVHAAATDHRIPRDSNKLRRPISRAEDLHPGQLRIIDFQRNQMNDRDRALAQRDVGVILCRDGAAGAAIALPLLERALKAMPADVPAREAQGHALHQLGRVEESLAAFRMALAQEPNRESALAGAAYCATQGARSHDAITYWRRAIAISPWRSEYHAELALACFQDRDWPTAGEVCRKTLELDPADLETRKLLVRCYLRLGNTAAARAELLTLLSLDPPDRNDLLEIFAPLAEPR